MIFFDLEFYVPKEDRNDASNRGTLVFNPTVHSHLLLGGVFYSKLLTQEKILTKKNIWLWNYRDQSSMLKDIFNFFEAEYIQMQKSTTKIHGSKRIKDLMTCGFGIGRIDLPTLFIKMQTARIANPSLLFNLFLKTKVIDLANVSAFLFPRETTFYPKTTNQVMKKLLKRPIFKHSGKIVWDYYDQGQFDEIENRCTKEVEETVEIYTVLQNILEKNESILSNLL